MNGQSRSCALDRGFVIEIDDTAANDNIAGFAILETMRRCDDVPGTDNRTSAFVNVVPTAERYHVFEFTVRSISSTINTTGRPSVCRCNRLILFFLHRKRNRQSWDLYSHR